MEGTFYAPRGHIITAVQETHVWMCTAGEVRDAVLTAEEETRAARFRVERDRLQFRAARALLRQVAGQLLGVPPSAVRFEAGPQGKPFVPETSLELNLSHSGYLIAVAAGSEPVGIDVERIKERTPIDSIAGRFFHGDEIAYLSGLPDDERRDAFFSLWTVKEAAMKADGRGVWLNLASIGIDEPSRAGVDPVRCLVSGVPWLVRPLSAPPDYRAALATRSETTIVVH
jgi:4'-phosphopantetheinyl transferase